jgi:hypothetical protein
MPHISVGVQILHGKIHHIGSFNGLSGLVCAVYNPAGLKISNPHTTESLALAGLYELIFDDRTRVTVNQDLQAGAELVGVITRHKSRR